MNTSTMMLPLRRHLSWPVVRDRLLSTSDDLGVALARIVLGIVMFPHAAQKTFGWFGGPGFSGAMHFMSHDLGIPAPLAALAIWGELAGALILVVGGLARVGALLIATIMLVAIAVVHWPYGFFMNWFGRQAGEGFEYHLLALALAAVVLFQGAGPLSIDRALPRLRRAELSKAARRLADFFSLPQKPAGR